MDKYIRIFIYKSIEILENLYIPTVTCSYMTKKAIITVSIYKQRNMNTGFVNGDR